MPSPEASVTTTDDRTTLDEAEMQAVSRSHSDQLQRIEDNVLALRAEILSLTLLVQNPMLRSTT